MKKEVVRVGIVLGHCLNPKCELDPDARSRIVKAYKLLKEGKVNRLILSGGFTKKDCPKVSEAKVFSKWLQKCGIKKSALILEEKSKDTLGNAIFSKQKLLELQKKLDRKNVSNEIYLITANYHLRRSVGIFKHIFGTKYSFVGIKSKPKILHRVRNALAEFESEGLDIFFLSQVKVGDHKQAEKLLYQELPQLYGYDTLQKNSVKKIVREKRLRKKKK